MSDMTKEEKTVLLNDAVAEVSRAIAASLEAAVTLNEQPADDIEAFIDRQKAHWEPEAIAAIAAYEQWRKKRGITGFVTM